MLEMLNNKIFNNLLETNKICNKCNKPKPLEMLPPISKFNKISNQLLICKDNLNNNNNSITPKLNNSKLDLVLMLEVIIIIINSNILMPDKKESDFFF